MRPPAIFAVFLIILATPSCVGGTIHGLSESEWFDLMESDKPLPISSDRPVDYEAISKLGPGALLFVAMHAQDAGDTRLATNLLMEAVKREEGRYRVRSVSMLADMLLAAGDGSGLTQLCESEAGRSLPAYRRAYLSAVGLGLSESYAQAAAAVDSIRAAYPTDSEEDAAPLGAMAFEFGYRAGRGRWANEFAAIVAMDASPAVYTALASMVDVIRSSDGDSALEAIRALGATTFELAEARSLVGARDYGPAVVAFRRYILGTETAEGAAARVTSTGPTAPAGRADDGEASDESVGSTGKGPMLPLSPKEAAGLFLSLPRAIASDAAKAFLAIAKDEGAEGFRYITDTFLDRGADPSRAYFDAFWRGRFLRAAERWDEAESWFSKATSLAANAAERDAAGWYAIEALWKRSKPAAIPTLAKVMAASKNPEYYSDLLESISREALVARNGSALASLDVAVSKLANAEDAARLGYLCGRAAKVGIITTADLAGAQGTPGADVEAYAAARLRAAYSQRADGWYRLLAAYRLEAALVDPFSEETAPAAPQARISEPPVVDADEYALALAKFGLGDRVRKELGYEFKSLSGDTVRSVAETLSAGGRYEQALRLIATQFWKDDFVPTRRDAELYWPRPYREEFSAAVAATGLDEFLLYGLARSESAFNPRAVSKSGATGLTQLMPATAAETAARLRMSDYDLSSPGDNLTIGSTYFARVLAGVDGRVLPAACSYNGGPTRFKRWEAQFGDLPLDLLLESLPYSETRQYGRSVVSAALAYAALYGEGDLKAYFAYLVGEGERP